MINTTWDVIILNEDKMLDCVDEFTKAMLHRGIVTAGLKRPPTKLYIDYKDPSVIQQGAFVHYLMPVLKDITVTRLRELYQITLIARGEPDKQEKIEHILDCKFHHPKVTAGVHAACLTLFVWLWEYGIAVLSANFKVIAKYRIVGKFRNEILDKLLGLQVTGAKSNQELAYYKVAAGCLTYILSTDWRLWTDVSLLGYWENLRTPDAITLSFHTAPKLLFELAADNGAAYTQKDVNNVFSRSGTQAAKLADPLILLDTLEQIGNYLAGSVTIKGIDGGILQIARKKGFSPLTKMKAKAANVRFGGSINDSIKLDVMSMSPNDKLAHYAKHNDMDHYFKYLPKLNKNHIDLNYLNKGFYPGLSVEPRIQFPEWCTVIEAYLKKIVTSINNRKALIAYLADYLFVYLVFFYESNTDAVHHLPTKIQDFSRVIFWDQTVMPQEFQANAPITLAEFIKERAPSNSGKMVNIAQGFFEFIKTNYCVYHPEFPDALVLNNFENPINQATDVSGKWKNKSAPTNKIAMPIETLPFVHNTLRVLNEAHNKLQKLLLKDENSSKRLSYTRRHFVFKLSDWDIDCSFELNGKTVRFDVIPDLFNWELGGGHYPALSCFRMLRTNVHAGQRMENIQWLDIDNFDQNSQGRVDGYFQPLWIDIDKIYESRVAKIPTFILDELQAEREYQRTYGLEISPIKSTYSEKLISPLFRSNAAHNTGGPFCDQAYYDLWVDILWFIQQHYNEFVPPSKQHSFVRLVPYKDSTGKNANNHQWNQGVPIIDSDRVYHTGNATALQMLAVHTPHSMRGTYTVARKGLIAYQDLLEQQGWTSEVTMHHYLQAMHQNDKERLLELADKSIMEGTCLTEGASLQALFLQGNNAIRPSKDGSAMSASLAAGAEAVIHDQCLISIRVIELDGYTGDDGLMMLKAQQRSIKPVIFDHCLCPAGGDCPKEIVEIIGERNRCGICPVACYGIDNISGLNARITEKREASKKGLIMLKRLEERNEDSSSTVRIKEQIHLNQSEVGSMRMTANLLEKNLERGELDRYLCRHPDMVKKVVKISIDTTCERNLFLSKLIEAQAHPQYCSEGFVDQCYAHYRRFNADKNKQDVESDPVQVVAGHLSAIMREKNIGINQLLSVPEFKQLVED
ncbi:MAG: hypothetical protein ACI88H_001236 [Cocleimonas sp.]|jgi:hypothetical protein